MIIHEEWHGYSAMLSYNTSDEDYGILHILSNDAIVYSVDTIEKLGDDASENDVYKLYDKTIWELMG
jgi:hypothetical protein